MISVSWRIFKQIRNPLSLILLLVTCSSSFGQAWFTQNSGTSQQLECVKFIDMNNGWACGGTDGYGIYSTRNGGATWTMQDTRMIHYLDFVDTNRGWAVGQPNLILYTTDGGTIWSQENSGTTTSEFFGVDFLDSNNGWVVGTNGVLKTTNAGVTWSPVSQISSGSWYAVTFIDNNHGWVCGSNGNIRRTTNGGATWNLPVVSNTNSTLYSITFDDDSLGWSVGAGSVIHTTDGGWHWTTQTTTGQLNLWSVSFVTANLGWVAGGYLIPGVGSGYGNVLWTTNGGTSWNTSGSLGPLFGIDFIDDTRGWAVGQGGVILHTTTGGITWIKDHSAAQQPTSLCIDQAYPNPFNPTTTIHFTVAKSTSARIDVYNLLGEVVYSRVLSTPVSGAYAYSIDGADWASGVYLVKLTAGHEAAMTKLVKLK